MESPLITHIETNYGESTAKKVLKELEGIKMPTSSELIGCVAHVLSRNQPIHRPASDPFDSYPVAIRFDETLRQFP